VQLSGSGKKICSDNKARTRIKGKGDVPAIRISRYHRSRAATQKPGDLQRGTARLDKIGRGLRALSREMSDALCWNWLDMAGGRVLASCAPSTALCR
jgi:hypothetical protein